MPQISICRSPKTEPPEPLETRTLVVRRIFDEGHHITLDVKCAGARSAGNPHATCDEAGAGNRLTVRLVRHSQRKRGEMDRPNLRSNGASPRPYRELFFADQREKSCRNVGLVPSKPAWRYLVFSAR